MGLCLCALLAGWRLSAPASADDIAERARKLHFSSIVLDTHDDTTQRFFSKNFDLGKRNPDGHVDIPRMREGGMNAIFFSIWIDGRIMGPPAVQKALDQIDAVHENVRKFSKDMVFARTAAEVRSAHAQGKIAALMGVEGGHMIGNDIRMVRIFGDLGVRYMTDEMIKALAAKGGVIHINYEKSFIDQDYKNAYDKATGGAGVVGALSQAIKECGDDQECTARAAIALERKMTEEGKLPHVSWERIVDHIDHAVKLVGAEHVGLGSDFDGASMPEGMEDCSKLPKITEALLRK